MFRLWSGRADRGKIEDARLEFDPIYKTDNNVEKGKVTDQRPDAGKKAKKGYWATRQVQCNVCGGEGVIWSGDQTVTCQVCGGAGYVIIPGESTTCTNCGGSGWVAEKYWVEQ